MFTAVLNINERKYSYIAIPLENMLVKEIPGKISVALILVFFAISLHLSRIFFVCNWKKLEYIR